MKTQTIYKRLVSRMIQQGDCWIWQGASANGYGYMWDGKKPRNAHRLMWETIHGPVPPKMFICHTCDNKLCINPNHLFLATPKENMDDMTRKGRRSCGPEHAAAMQKAWTTELRNRQSSILCIAKARKHAELAAAAGVPTNWKYCPGCKTWFSRNNFDKNGARHDGLSPYCKDCKRDQTNKRRRSRKQIIETL